MVATTPGHNIPWHRRWELATVVPAALLTMLMVWSVVQSVANAGWAEGLDMLAWIGLPALLVGIVFGRLHWASGWLAHPLAAVLGLVWAVQQVGPILIKEVGRDLGTPLGERLNTWGDQATEIMIRVLAWWRILQAGGRGEDIVLYVLALGLLTWALGYTTGWLLFRSGRTWSAVFLNAAIILVNYTYAWPKPNVLFFVFLSAALLLIAHQQIVQQQRTWQAAQIEFPDYLAWRFTAAAAVVCGLLVLATSFLPSNISNAQLARAWEVLKTPYMTLRDGWNSAFSTIQAPPGTSGVGFTTRNVRVGGGRILQDDIVMRVRSPKYEYWRAVTFDRYTGRGWQSNIGERARTALGALTAEEARVPLEPGPLPPQTDLAGRSLITQTVEVVEQRNDRLLMVGGQLAGVGLPALAQTGFLVNETGVLRPNYTELAAVFVDAPVLDSRTYTITSYVSLADQQSLRTAGTSYPAWIAESYLQLPETVTQRTRDLARRVIAEANATTPFDQAVAIEHELRRLTYDDQRPPPVEGGDWVDYFLFESKRGYCDDFATSFVVLMRSLGVPARWAQGYAGGTLDAQTGAYVVRESLAHSWPEVYFPGYGWQRFEPTPAAYASGPDRPEQAAAGGASGPVSASGNLPEAPDDGLEQRRGRLEDLNQDQAGGDLAALQREIEARRLAEQQRQVLLGAAVLLGLLALGGLAMLWLDRDVRGLQPAAATYLRLQRLAGWAGLPQGEHVTPYEYAAQLSAQIPGQQRTFERIASAYVAERYGGSRQADAAKLADDWRYLRGELLGRMVARLIPAPRRPRRSA